MAIGIVSAGVLLMSLVITWGGELSAQWWKTRRPLSKVSVEGILTKTNTNTKGEEFYLIMDNYWWDNQMPVFKVQVVPVSENWQEVRKLVGTNVKIKGIGDKSGPKKITIGSIEATQNNEDIEGKRKIDNNNWNSVMEEGLGVRVNYPKNMIKKTGNFNQKTTWVWEGITQDEGEVWGMTIGSDRPWASEDRVCEGVSWGCREIGTIKILIGGKEYEAPIWVTGSGGRIFQFVFEGAAGQPTVTGYYAIKSQGQLLADILSQIK